MTPEQRAVYILKWIYGDEFENDQFREFVADQIRRAQNNSGVQTVSDPNIWHGPGQRHLVKSNFSRNVSEKPKPTAPRAPTPAAYLCMTPRNGRVTWMMYDADTLPMWFDGREKHWPGMRVKGINADEFASGIDAMIARYGAEMVSQPLASAAQIIATDEMTATEPSA